MPNRKPVVVSSDSVHLTKGEKMVTYQGNCDCGYKTPQYRTKAQVKQRLIRHKHKTTITEWKRVRVGVQQGKTIK